MYRITILVVGRIKSPWIAEGCAEFMKRLRPHVRLEIIELPASRSKEPGKQASEESEEILHRLQDLEGEVLLLDERGKSATSQEFSDLLGAGFDRGVPFTFILGGAYGVTQEVRDTFRGSLRLSDMTLTHEMARLLLLEQLYRACEMRKGSGYHH